jgi:heme/copper-type cytochrome/quinol oxidase subunit 3
MKSNIKLLLKGLIYGILWFLFISFTPPSVVTIDPCSATPGYDYSNMLFILPSYFFIFLILGIYYIHNTILSRELKLSYLFLLIIILPFSCLMLSYKLFFSIIEIDLLYKYDIWNYFYEHEECYNNKEVKELPLNILSTILLVISSYLILLLFIKIESKNESKHNNTFNTNFF